MKFKNLNLLKFWDRVYRWEYKNLNQFKLWDRVYRGNIKNLNQFKFWDSFYRREYQVVAVFSWPSYYCSSLPSHSEILLPQAVCFAYRPQFQHQKLPFSHFLLFLTESFLVFLPFSLSSTTSILPDFFLYWGWPIMYYLGVLRVHGSPLGCPLESIPSNQLSPNKGQNLGNMIKWCQLPLRGKKCILNWTKVLMGMIIKLILKHILMKQTQH